MGFAFGQNETDAATNKTFKKVAWQYDFGLGIQRFDPTLLNSSLLRNNYSSDLSNTLFGINYSMKAVFFDKLSTGLAIESGSTSDLGSTETSVSLIKAGIGLKIGYDIFTSPKSKFSLNYGIYGDFNSLTLTDSAVDGLTFDQALNQRISQTLFSVNASNKFSVRYDFLFVTKQTEKGTYTPSLGVEMGYGIAGNNKWENIRNGPEIDNSGLFVNIVYGIRFNKYTTSKTKR